MSIRTNILLLFAFLLPLSQEARTIVVMPTDPQPAILNALQKAKPYDTIRIQSGTYREGPLTIFQPQTIIGDNWPVIDGRRFQQPISVKSSYVSISGLVVTNCGNTSMEDWAGIKIYNVHDVYIFNNRLDNNYFGIYAAGARNCYISGNVVKAYGLIEQTSGNGIHAWKCDSMHITDNNVGGHRDGIYFEFVTNSQIERNHSEGNIRYGLHFMFSHHNHYEGNAFVHNGAGVAVMYSKQVSMVNNTFGFNQGAAAYGLLLKDISDSDISDNDFTGNTCGIFMEGCARSTIEHNRFHQNGWAIKLQASCDNDTISYNNFTGNTFDVSTNNSLVLNHLSNNYWDKYEGYDLNKDGIGDVPYHPASLYSMLADQMPYAMMLWRSFCVYLLDRAEKVIPSISPDNLRDDAPRMASYDPGSKY
jgi:nitrous oxidase accessory protein